MTKTQKLEAELSNIKTLLTGSEREVLELRCHVRTIADADENKALRIKRLQQEIQWLKQLAMNISERWRHR